MARITKPAKTEAASAPAAKATGKVAKLDKATPAAKPEKAAKAAAEPKAPRRGQWNGLKIALTDAGKVEAPARGDALIRFQQITKFKTTDEAIGSEYQIGNGETRKILGVDIKYLVDRGLITAE